MFKALALSGLLVAVVATGCDKTVPNIAAGALLRPARNRAIPPTPSGCVDREFAGAEVTLRGWACRTEAQRKGTILYLHGIADNRSSGVGTIHRYTAQGFDVVAYDSRAHGQSDGEYCTYGFYEKEDLRRVIDSLPQGPIVLVGTSLGAAVALLRAAEDDRVAAVVAAEVFSNLERVARERAPRFVPERLIRKAFAVAETRAAFRIRDVSPEVAARQIRVPALIIHGDADSDTSPSHSKRVYEALAGPKRLILVAGARHNRSLSGGAVWREIDGWLREVLGSPQSPAPLNWSSSSANSTLKLVREP